MEAAEPRGDVIEAAETRGDAVPRSTHDPELFDAAVLGEARSAVLGEARSAVLGEARSAVLGEARSAAVPLALLGDPGAVPNAAVPNTAVPSAAAARDPDVAGAAEPVGCAAVLGALLRGDVLPLAEAAG